MKKTRILIADDHEIVRRGLRPLIESEWGWEICGEAKDGREAIALAGELKPDIVVLDVGMPEMGGVEVTREIKRLLPETGVLAFTGTESETLVHQLFAAGVRGCVLKSEAADHLIPAIKSLCNQQPYLASRISRVVFESYLKGGPLPEHAAPGGLTPRERETVQFLANGKSNKEVAAALGISVKTVETHRATIMRKLGFTAFSELVRYAVRNHLVQG
ncbi:MAG: response regulator transcription factor [Chthoniobacteraceae bacterium]